jgi:threonine synthase
LTQRFLFQKLIDKELERFKMINFYSTNQKAPKVSLKEAVLNGLAPDGGLYFPEVIPTLSNDFFNKLPSLSFQEIGIEVATPFLNGLASKAEIETMVNESMNFPIVLNELSDGTVSLELFHGPTLAFKDVGARFMSRLLRHFVKDLNNELHILVATSGDTGSAVASGFHKVDGIRVTILYPKGKVSPLQEKQLTTYGDNVQAIEIDGTFDDCQRLVKTAFGDSKLSEELNLTSANSINFARLLPQSFYYFYCNRLVQKGEGLVVSVPSGNYGNITAGLIGHKMGLPIKKFVAASNANSIVPQFLDTGDFNPRASIQTYSNAMDVGNPSNFPRMMEIFSNDHKAFAEKISSGILNDQQNLEAIRACLKENDYLTDPHGAIGWSVLKSQLKQGEKGVFLETAHPAKFIEIMAMAVPIEIKLPKVLAEISKKDGVSIPCENDYGALIEILKA